MSTDLPTPRVLAEPSNNQDATVFRAQLLSIVQAWPILLLCILLGAGTAAVINQTTPEKYESTLTFFVATTGGASSISALQADEFAQRRINSYVGVLGSELLATTVLKDTGLDLQPAEISQMIGATVNPDTVLMNVTVTDEDPDRAVQVAGSIARNLDPVIASVDNRESKSQVALRVISGPTLNPDPVSPRRTLNLAVGSALGLALGMAVALAVHQFDTSFRNREALAAASGVPTLVVLSADPAARKDPILAPGDNRSRRAEGFRQLRTNLRFVNAASPAQVLVITSSVESEGKTTTAINLAQAFAQASVRTLIVDADLRRPKLERHLDLEASAGLTTALVADASWRDLIQEWGPDGLMVLASGQIPPNPSELLSSEAMSRFVREVRDEFEVVIIDTPPVLPVTDGVVTSVLADGVLFVVRYGSTKRDQVLSSMEALRSVGAKVLGTVMTRAPASDGTSSSSYYGHSKGSQEG